MCLFRKIRQRFIKIQQNLTNLTYGYILPNFVNQSIQGGLSFLKTANLILNLFLNSRISAANGFRLVFG
jgi:hypothetical protein